MYIPRASGARVTPNRQMPGPATPWLPVGERSLPSSVPHGEHRPREGTDAEIARNGTARRPRTLLLRYETCAEKTRPVANATSGLSNGEAKRETNRTSNRQASD